MSIYSIDLDKLKILIEKQENLINELELSRESLRNLINNNLDESIYSGQDADEYRENMLQIIDVYMVNEINKLAREKDIFCSAYEAYVNCKKYCTSFGNAFNIASDYMFGYSSEEGFTLCDTDLVDGIVSLSNDIFDSHSTINSNVFSAFNVVDRLESNQGLIGDAIGDFKSNVSKLEVMYTHKSQLIEYAGMIVEADDWFANSLLDNLSDAVIAAHNAEFTMAPELSQYIFLSLKQDPNADEVVLRNQLRARILKDGLGIDEMLNDVLDKDYTLYTDRDYAVMAIGYERAVEIENIETINNIFFKIDEASMDYHFPCGDKWYIYNSPACSMLDYLDPKESGEAYYSLCMYFNAERKFDDLDHQVAVYKNQNGRLCFYEETIQDYNGEPYIAYIGQFVDMNDYMTEEALDNLKNNLNMTEEEIMLFYAGVGSDIDIKMVASLSEIHPYDNSFDWGNDFWEEYAWDENAGEVTAACGKSVVVYAYHILYDTDGKSDEGRINAFLAFNNGLLEAESRIDYGDLSYETDFRFVMYRNMSIGAIDIFSNKAEELMVNQSNYLDPNYNRVYNNMECMGGFFCAQADFIREESLDGGGRPQLNDPFGDRLLKGCYLDGLSLTETGIGYNIHYETIYGEGKENVSVVSNYMPTDDERAQVQENLNNYNYDHKFSTVTRNCLKIVADYTGGEYISHYSHAEMVEKNFVYLYGIFNDDSKEYEETQNLHYYDALLGNTCVYSFNRCENSWLCDSNSELIQDRVAFSTTHSPVSLYLFDQIENEGGIGDVMIDGNFEENLERAQISGDLYEADYYGAEQPGHGSELLGIRNGNFDSLKYIEENGEISYVQLIYAYNNIAEPTADFESYVTTMRTKYMNEVFGEGD